MSQEPLPHRIRHLHYALRSAIDAGLKEEGLTAAQLEVLGNLFESGCIEHREMLQRTNVASPTLTKLVNSLVQKGLIERTPSSEDARVKNLVITEAGRAIQEKLAVKRSAFLEDLMVGFSDAETMMLHEFVERLILNTKAMTD